MKKFVALAFAGLLLAGCADTSACDGQATWGLDGIVCTGPGHG